MLVKNFFFACIWSRSGSRIRIRIQIRDSNPESNPESNPDPKPDPKLTSSRIRILNRIRNLCFGSATLLKIKNKEVEFSFDLWEHSPKISANLFGTNGLTRWRNRLQPLKVKRRSPEVPIQTELSEHTGKAGKPTGNSYLGITAASWARFISSWAFSRNSTNILLSVSATRIVTSATNNKRLTSNKQDNRDLVFALGIRPVLWIRDIMVQIQIRATYWFLHFCQWLSRCQQKIRFFIKLFCW